MRATFLDELLAAEIADEQAVIQRSVPLGYDLNRPHVAWFIEAASVTEWPAPLLRSEQLGYARPMKSSGSRCPALLANRQPGQGPELKAVAANLINQVTAKSPKAVLVIGIGRWQSARLVGWKAGDRRGKLEAWQGVERSAGHLFRRPRLSTSCSPHSAAAPRRRAYRKTLGKLLRRRKNAELVDTLEAFFACHGNLSQTASLSTSTATRLPIAPERISAITQLDLDDPDARFSLQLALKLRPIMK